MSVELPRHVRPKKLASGATAYYYDIPTRYRAMKCPVPNEPLGTDFAVACEKAKTLNGLFDEWDQRRKGQPVSTPNEPKFGTVDWLFREYKQIHRPNTGACRDCFAITGRHDQSTTREASHQAATIK